MCTHMCTWGYWFDISSGDSEFNYCPGPAEKSSAFPTSRASDKHRTVSKGNNLYLHFLSNMEGNDCLSCENTSEEQSSEGEAFKTGSDKDNPVLITPLNFNKKFIIHGRGVVVLRSRRNPAPKSFTRDQMDNSTQDQTANIVWGLPALLRRGQ